MPEVTPKFPPPPAVLIAIPIDVIPIEDFSAHAVEEHVEHSNALHSSWDSRTYLVGPLARYSLNHHLLPPVAREAAAAAGLGAECRNPFASIVVRAVELLTACEEALRLVREYVPLWPCGVTCTFAHPTIWTWVTGGVTDDRLRAAVAIARRYKPPPEPIPIAYLAKIVDGLAESDREPDWDAVFRRPDEEAQA